MKTEYATNGGADVDALCVKVSLRSESVRGLVSRC